MNTYNKSPEILESALIELFILLILLAIIIITYNKLKTKNDKTQNNIPNTQNKEPVWERIILEDGTEFYKLANSSNTTNRSKWMPYIKRELLTRTEHIFWEELRKQCTKCNLLICPKVRMEDFIEVNINVKDFKEKSAWRGKIKSRHIDFMLCDINLNIIAAVELDDKSHLTPAAKKADEFKNEVLYTIGIPLYRVSVDKGNYKQRIELMLRQLGCYSNIAKENKPSETQKIPDKPYDNNIKNNPNIVGKYSGGTKQ